MVADPRKRIFIDRKVQGILLFRIVTYWALSLLTTGIVLLSWNLIKGPISGSLKPFEWSTVWEQYSAVLVASLVILPVLLFDCLTLSSRFVGPVLRMRGLIRALTAGKKVEGMDLRGGDFWPEMARDFNGLLVYVNMLRIQSEKACQAPEAEGFTEPMTWETAR